MSLELLKFMGNGLHQTSKQFDIPLAFKVHGEQKVEVRLSAGIVGVVDGRGLFTEHAFYSTNQDDKTDKGQGVVFHRRLRLYSMDRISAQIGRRFRILYLYVTIQIRNDLKKEI